MHRRSTLTEVQREQAVAWFELGLGYTAVATSLGVSQWPVRKLYHRWRLRGRGALVAKPTKPSYSFEFKLALVNRFLAGETAPDLAAEAGLSSPDLLATWVRWYRTKGADGLRPKPKGRPPARSRPSTPRQAAEPDELERLRREIERLRAEVAYLGKLQALMAHERR